jgi:DNA-binding MarR family transcriptional regulator
MRDDEVATFRAQLKMLQRRLRRELPPGQQLSRTHLQVLGAIDRLPNGPQPSQVAAILQMTSSNVAAALRELDEAGLIQRERDEADARRVRLALTARGIELVAKFRAERDTWLGRAVEAMLTPGEQRSLVAAGQLLERLAQYEPADRL